MQFQTARAPCLCVCVFVCVTLCLCVCASVRLCVSETAPTETRNPKPEPETRNRIPEFRHIVVETPVIIPATPVQGVRFRGWRGVEGAQCSSAQCVGFVLLRAGGLGLRAEIRAG